MQMKNEGEGREVSTSKFHLLIMRSLPPRYKMDIRVAPSSHPTEAAGSSSICHLYYYFFICTISRVLDEKEERRMRKMREWVDECLLRESCTMESVSSVMAVAVACLHKDPARRPSMVEIVYALSKSDDLFFDVSEDGLSPRQGLAR